MGQTREFIRAVAILLGMLLLLMVVIGGVYGAVLVVDSLAGKMVAAVTALVILLSLPAFFRRLE